MKQLCGSPTVRMYRKLFQKNCEEPEPKPTETEVRLKQLEPSFNIHRDGVRRFVARRNKKLLLLQFMSPILAMSLISGVTIIADPGVFIGLGIVFFASFVTTGIGSTKVANTFYLNFDRHAKIDWDIIVSEAELYKKLSNLTEYLTPEPQTDYYSAIKEMEKADKDLHEIFDMRLKEGL